jgi:ribosomal protein L29
MLKDELILFRDLSTAELEEKCIELQKFMFQLKMDQKRMQLNDTSLFKKTRHKLAFINMLLTQRSLSEV